MARRGAHGTPGSTGEGAPKPPRKGFFERIAQAIGGSEIGEVLGAEQRLRYAIGLRHAGAPTEFAIVAAVHDTGMTINDNPRIALELDLATQRFSITTVVSRLEIPRPGDHVALVHDPNTGRLLYAGLAGPGA